MIISFSVSNFRSFAEEETISFLPSDRTSGHLDHLLDLPDAAGSVLRSAVVYGANGAGKSNLVQALAYVKGMATRPLSKFEGTGRSPFRFGEWSQRPSIFDIQFLTTGGMYRFGFVASESRIEEEWLASLEDGREQTIYERRTDASGALEVALHLEKPNPKLEALAVVGGPANQTFLATALHNLPDGVPEPLGQVTRWFRETLTVVGASGAPLPSTTALAADPNLRNFVANFLRESGTGVDDLVITKEDIDEEEAHTRPSETYEGWNLIFDPATGRYSLASIHALHPGTATVKFELSEESDGTRRLIELVQATRSNADDRVLVIDEIDRSLHPILVRNFVDYFLRSSQGSRRQLIASTHESNLLDLELLRRDEIWFIEKDATGASHMYSLTDFQPRNDDALRKHYLQGRFGAVPFLGNLDRLIEPQGAGLKE